LSAMAGATEAPYDGASEGLYGRIKLVIVCGLCLIFYITFLSCLAIYSNWNNSSYRDDGNEPDNEVTVNETAVAEITVTATPDYK